MLQVDQIVGQIGEEGLPAMGGRPARGRISRRDELGHDRRRRVEGGIVPKAYVATSR